MFSDAIKTTSNNKNLTVIIHEPHVEGLSPDFKCLSSALSGTAAECTWKPNNLYRSTAHEFRLFAKPLTKIDIEIYINNTALRTGADDFDYNVNVTFKYENKTFTYNYVVFDNFKQLNQVLSVWVFHDEVPVNSEPSEKPIVNHKAETGDTIQFTYIMPQDDNIVDLILTGN